MTIRRDQTIGEIAVAYPGATRVFARHGIDYCCGGGKPLVETCATKQLDADDLLDEIRRELTSTTASPDRWADRPLGELIDHILVTYHRPLAEELPRLDAMARKVRETHGDKKPAVLSELASTMHDLRHELEQHMLKEEEILFPMIRRGQGASAEGPIACMEHEHEDAGSALARLRALTDDYRVPAEACTTWRALWHGLAELETAMHEHIHLENNILFPRALGSRT